MLLDLLLSYFRFVYLCRRLVIGCPDLEAPSGGWVKNNEEIAVFGCSAGPETWQMVCRGTEWIGERANCSIGGAQTYRLSSRYITYKNASSFHNTVSVISLTAVVLFTSSANGHL